MIDRRTTASSASVAPGGVLPGFWAYQAFVAPSAANLTAKNELFVAASADGGFTWTIQSVGCSVDGNNLDNAFPALSVDPSGNLWAAWSDGTNVDTAVSTDHGATWSCSASVSPSGLRVQALEPTLVATSAGIDLAYYATPDSLDNDWNVYFVQNLTGTIGGWGTPVQLNLVHSGYVCLPSSTCPNPQDGPQLHEDFGIDVDASGWAHIAYSHDAPSPSCQWPIGCPGTYTGYLVQFSGSQVGYHN